MHTPFYLIDEARLEANLDVLASVRRRAGVKILLAQKAFSCFDLYPLVAGRIDGAAASGLFEARLAHEEMPDGENHVFSPAFRAEDIAEILSVADHVVFNSPRQLSLYARMARDAGVSPGLRVNPEVSVATTPAYDPCRPGSRLGTTRDALDASGVGAESFDGLHFHCLCEQGTEELRKVLAGFEERFGDLIPNVKWVNFGGGHHITREGYDVDGLVEMLLDFKSRHPGLAVYLEPGEAVALNAGTLEASVLEVQPPGADGVSNAILDVSAACHMPDVLEMPYTPRVVGATMLPNRPNLTDLPNRYRLGGPTCLAGDEIGTYSFERPLVEGDRVVFEDMAIYSMVKNNTFNGMPLPSIAVRRKSGKVELLREFGYADFKTRLGSLLTFGRTE